MLIFLSIFRIFNFFADLQICRFAEAGKRFRIFSPSLIREILEISRPGCHKGFVMNPITVVIQAYRRILEVGFKDAIFRGTEI